MGTLSLQKCSPAEKFGCTNNFHSQMVSWRGCNQPRQFISSLKKKKSLCHHSYKDTGHKATVNKLNSLCSSLGFLYLDMSDFSYSFSPAFHVSSMEEKIKSILVKTRLIIALPWYILCLICLLWRVATAFRKSRLFSRSFLSVYSITCAHKNGTPKKEKKQVSLNVISSPRHSGSEWF